MLFLAYWRVDGYGGHSSKAITMSAPMLRWMSITFSGENKCLLPSMWLRNVAPASVIFRFSAKLNTWYPPLSVKIGRSQFMNL